MCANKTGLICLIKSKDVEQLNLFFVGKVNEFTFIPMHAKPKDAIAEMNSLVTVYEEAEKLFGPVCPC